MPAFHVIPEPPLNARRSSIVSTCHTKCIAPKYHEADMNKGESVCVDRCVAKYMDVHQRVGAKLSKLQAPPAE